MHIFSISIDNRYTVCKGQNWNSAALEWKVCSGMVVESLVGGILVALGQGELVPDLAVLVQRLSRGLGQHRLGAGSRVQVVLAFRLLYTYLLKSNRLATYLGLA